MLRTLPTPLLLAGLLALAGCASNSGTAEVPMDVTGAETVVRTLDNGDVAEEYRIAGQLRMVKITPVRGPAYYLYDRDGDGRFDNDRDSIPAVHWKLFSW